jgi:hypothetical protein
MRTVLCLFGSWIYLSGGAVGSFAQGSFQNGDFESPGLPVEFPLRALFSAGDTSITGWTTVPGTNGTYIGSVEYVRYPQDNHFVELGYYFGMNGLRQTFSTDPNQPYLVTFSLATDALNGPPAWLRVSAGGPVADYAALGSVGGMMQWQEQSFLFTSDASGSTTLTFYNGAGTIPVIDTIAVTPVPEPGTWALLGLGAFILVLAKHRRSVSITSPLATTRTRVISPR